MVTTWKSARMDPNHISALEVVMARRAFWRASPQSSNRVDWIGNAVAEAFEVDRSNGNWKQRVKTIIKSLERQGILTPSEAKTDQRKSAPTLVFNRPLKVSE